MSEDLRPLARSFLERPSPAVAPELLGCWIVRRTGSRVIRVQISEVEAYLGELDPASHARRGATPRNQVMFGPAGHAYVYFVYGIHHCLNVVTGAEGEAAAVLLRAALATAGLPRLDGPGRLCRGLQVDLSHNRGDLCSPRGELALEWGRAPLGWAVVAGPRVGVKDPTPWRFRLVPKRREKRSGHIGPLPGFAGAVRTPSGG